MSFQFSPEVQALIDEWKELRDRYENARTEEERIELYPVLMKLRMAATVAQTYELMAPVENQS